jgi:hypothetical protein
MAAPADDGAIAMEKLTAEQLAEKRVNRWGELHTLRPENKVQEVMLKNVHQAYKVLTYTEDVLISLKGIEPGDQQRDKWKAAMAMQRKAVLECTDMFNQLRMQIEFGAAAVEAVFHGAKGYEDLSEEQVQRFKEMRKMQEKEKDQAKQLQLKMAQQTVQYQQSRRGARAAPYYYGGPRPQFYVQSGGMMQQQAVPMGGMLPAAAGQQMQVQAMQPIQQHLMQQQVPQQQLVYQHQGLQGQVMAGMQAVGGQAAPPALVRAPGAQARARAACYNCGKGGHFGHDGVCLPADIEAFQVFRK